MQFSNKYIVVFSILVCLGCSLVVSALAVSLKEKQKVNKELDRRINILRVAGIVEEGVEPTADEIAKHFETIKPLAIDRKTGRILDDFDLEGYDPGKAAKDPSKSVVRDEIKDDQAKASAKGAQISRIPDVLLVYDIQTPGKESFVFPIWGNGLWSTLWGFFAISKDRKTVIGITYYDHGETPGLGGEVENPNWKALWPGKKAFDDDGAVKIRVAKGPGRGEYEVDGLAGATITSNGVTAMLEFWLSDSAYGQFLKSGGES